MNLFQLIFKQMRERALGTWLTLLSVMLGMALAVAVFLMLGAGNALFGQTEYGFDVLIGIGQGSPLQLVLNTIYHIDRSPGNIPYWVYEQVNNPEHPPRGSREFNFNQQVRTAVPIAVGDTYKGRPIVGSPPKMFVTVEPLKHELQELSDKQHQIAIDARQNPRQLADLAPRQQACKNDLLKFKEAMQKVERETTPFVEMPTDTSDSGAKWLYGKPAVLDVDAALSDCDAASAATAANDSAKATLHLQAIETALENVRRAISFESGPFEYKEDSSYQIAQGSVYHAWKLEAVIGSEVADSTGLGVGSKFQATHGNPKAGETPDIHPEQWQIVGVMKPTHTAADRCLYIPLMSFYCIAEHEGGLKAHQSIREGREAAPVQPTQEGPPPYKLVYGDTLDPSLPHTQEYIALDTPRKDWEVSALMVKSRGGVSAERLRYFIQNGGLQANVQAIIPAQVMQEFFDTFFKGSTLILLVIALLVSIVAAVGILVSIYNSVAARKKEIAILRALGATRARILSLICLEAGMIGFFGGILGLIGGHGLGAIASSALNARLGQGFNWIVPHPGEWLYLCVVVLIALIAGLVPAVKAYRTPVATNLTAA